MKNVKYGIATMVIVLLLGTGITTVWLDTKGATSQKENVSHNETISDHDSSDNVVNGHVDSSEISYESSVEILDEETFKEEIEKDAQNGEKAIDANEEDKDEKN